MHTSLFSTLWRGLSVTDEQVSDLAGVPGGGALIGAVESSGGTAAFWNQSIYVSAYFLKGPFLINFKTYFGNLEQDNCMLDGFSHSHSLGGDILVLIAAVARCTFRITRTLGDGRSSQQLNHILSAFHNQGLVQKNFLHTHTHNLSLQILFLPLCWYLRA